MKLKIIALAGLALLTFQINTQAQNWTGNVNSDWNNSANWSVWPLNGQNITIDPALYTGSAMSPVISANSVFSPGDINLLNGAQLTIAGNLTTQGDVNAIDPGTQLIVNNGIFSVDPGNGGRLIIDLGSQMLVSGGTVVVDERFIAGEDAVITINNGTVSSGDRILMNLGGHIIQNGGTVSVNPTFAMADGSLLNHSGYELNAGTLTVTGAISLENEAGDFEPFFHMNGGNLNVNGDVFWFGSTPGTGTPRFIIQGGNASVTGLIQNMPLSTVDLYLKIGGSSTLNFSGTLIESLHAEDSIIQNGSGAFILSNTNTINNPGVFIAENVTTTFNGNTSLQGTGSYQFHDISIPATRTLNHLNPADIMVSGDISKDGSFIANTNTLVLNGIQAQQLTGTGSYSLANLTLMNKSVQGIDLFIPMSLSGSFQLLEGKLNTTTGSLLTLQDNATSGPGNDSSFLNGPMVKVGNDAFIFPIGKNLKWRRLGISAPTGITSSFQAEYYDQSYPFISPVDTPLVSVSNLEYWDLQQAVGSSSLIVQLFWEDALQSAILNCNDLAMAHWGGSSWDPHLSISSGSCMGNGTGSLSTISPISIFGPLTFGFVAGITTQNIDICDGDSLQVGTNFYTAAGIYFDTLLDMNLNDSVVVTNLHVIIPNTGITVSGLTLVSDNTVAVSYQWVDCGTFTPIPGQGNPSYTPTGSGSYALIVNEAGCMDTSACYIYNFQSPQICNGDSLVVGDSAYYLPGQYINHLQSPALVDSIVISDLLVITPDTSISLFGDTLRSNNVLASAFQWLDCNTNYAPISGETGMSFTPIASGSYAVMITQNGCVDTSRCETVLINDLDPLTDKARISVYPNPFQDELRISFLAESENGSISIYDVKGSLVSRTQISPSQRSIRVELDVEPGIYLLRFADGNHLEHHRLIKY